MSEDSKAVFASLMSQAELSLVVPDTITGKIALDLHVPEREFILYGTDLKRLICPCLTLS